MIHHILSTIQPVSVEPRGDIRTGDIKITDIHRSHVLWLRTVSGSAGSSFGWVSRGLKRGITVLLSGKVKYIGADHEGSEIRRTYERLPGSVLNGFVSKMGDRVHYDILGDDTSWACIQMYNRVQFPYELIEKKSEYIVTAKNRSAIIICLKGSSKIGEIEVSLWKVFAVPKKQMVNITDMSKDAMILVIY